MNNALSMFGLLLLPVIGGIAATWLWAKQKDRQLIALRLSKLAGYQAPEVLRPATLLKRKRWLTKESTIASLSNVPGIDNVRQLLVAAGLETRFRFFCSLLGVLLCVPVVLAVLLNFDVVAALAIGLVLTFIPFIVLKIRVEQMRTKFIEQLPDALDLMVAVLRSGHSVSQAVKAVANDMPQPCGQEFGAVLHRMNLGQPLSEALINSTRRFQCYELDLVRRAVTLQTEVGGSLSELFEKTNMTLRERLKLARHLRVITSQSRLSAYIVGLLPIVLACVLNTLNPGYLDVLMQDPMGKTLLCVAVGLEMVGMFMMQKMSTMRL